jgi:predicted hotdog family 3-hydroxylacyl-ACP dehydratase
LQLDRAWIAAHIPHQRGMCLLDEVLDWTDAGIRCRSRSHRELDNPLRAHGRLGAASGIEYAAQAMAVHGALRTVGRDSAPVVGLLASVRGVLLNVERLDDIDDDLVASAICVHGDASLVLYEFTVSDTARVLLTGRATIAFGAAIR